MILEAGVCLGLLLLLYGVQARLDFLFFYHYIYCGFYHYLE